MDEIKRDCSETREWELCLESINLMTTKQKMEHQNTSMQVKNLSISICLQCRYYGAETRDGTSEREDARQNPACICLQSHCCGAETSGSLALSCQMF